MRYATLPDDIRVLDREDPVDGGIWASRIGLLMLVVLCNAVIALGALAVDPIYPYGALERPWWTPDVRVIGAAAVVVFTLAGLAAWLVERQKGDVGILVHWAMPPFRLLPVMATAWAGVFFGLQAPLIALAVAIILFCTVVITMMRFALLSRDACWMLLPLLAAAGVVVAFTGVIIGLNPDAPLLAPRFLPV